MRWNLVDEYVLLIHPLVLGSGRRLFPDDGAFAAHTLCDSKTTTNGVVIATYEPANNRNAVGRGLRIAERESGECTVIRKEPAPRTQHQRVDQETYSSTRFHRINDW